MRGAEAVLLLLWWHRSKGRGRGTVGLARRGPSRRGGSRRGELIGARIAARGEVALNGWRTARVGYGMRYVSLARVALCVVC